MTDREKLILDITKSDKATNEKCKNCTDPKGSSTYCGKCACEQLANNLLAEGWIKPPCKVGDKLYIIADVSKAIVESVVMGVWMIEDSVSILTIHGTIINNSFGKTVFLTKEEAEAKLKELNK